jgi:hypothetical protein
MSESLLENTHACNICNKSYASKSSLRNHNNKFHKTPVENNVVKPYNCRICCKLYNTSNSRWKHEKLCKVKKEEISNNVQNINQNIEGNNNLNHSNNTVNHITINNFGHETVDKLTKKQIKELANMKLNAYIGIIELLNFNKDLPENHTFCVTSLEGDYVNCLNTKTNQIEKINKKDFLDKVLNNALSKLEDLLFNIEFKTTANACVKQKYYEQLQEVNSQKDKMVGNRHRKLYHTNINQLSYNKKKLILDTWKTMPCKEETESDSETESSIEKTPYEYDMGLDNLDNEADNLDDEADNLDDETDNIDNVSR